MRHNTHNIAGLYQQIRNAQMSIGRSDAGSRRSLSEAGESYFSPIVPVASMWERHSDPDRYYRIYHFRDTEELLWFMKSVYDICDGTQGSWLDTTIHTMPSGVVVHISVHRGGSTLTDNEVCITQDLDSVYDYSDAEIAVGPSVYGLDEEYDFEDFDEEQEQ